MNTLIQSYRGVEINFDTDREVFSCVLEDYGKESKSFAAIKRGIDDFLKNNSTFKPFDIISIPGYNNVNKRFKVVGIRKDGRFILEDEKGVKSQLSEYNEKYYLVYTQDLEAEFVKIAVLQSIVDDANKKVKEAIESVTAPLVKSIKVNYLP